jgi:hypothetical protein
MILNDKPNCQVSKILMKLRPIYVKCSETHIFEIPKFHDFNVFYKKKKCVAYPQEDFLFKKLITNLRISLRNNRKKDFFYMNYLNFTFLGSHDSRLHFRPHKVYFFSVLCQVFYMPIIGHVMWYYWLYCVVE